MNTLDEFNMQDTHVAMFCNNKAPIDITYNHKLGKQSKYIDVA
jgi:hypothetical protein